MRAGRYDSILLQPNAFLLTAEIVTATTLQTDARPISQENDLLSREYLYTISAFVSNSRSKF